VSIESEHFGNLFFFFLFWLYFLSISLLDKTASKFDLNFFIVELEFIPLDLNLFFVKNNNFFYDVNHDRTQAPFVFK
jgi:hypothetical protein